MFQKRNQVTKGNCAERKVKRKLEKKIACKESKGGRVV
jgi:hypothetical protein